MDSYYIENYARKTKMMNDFLYDCDKQWKLISLYKLLLRNKYNNNNNKIIR